MPTSADRPMERPSSAYASVPGRRVGLSVNQKPRRLLSQIGGRPAQKSEDVSIPEPRLSQKMSRDARSEEHDPLTAPPESSDNEEESRSTKELSRRLPSDSDDDGPLPGDIIPTKFGKENRPPKPQASNPLRRTRRATAKGGVAASSSQSEGPSSSAGLKRSGEESGQAKLSSHLEDEFGFSRQSKKPKIYAPGRHKPKMLYKKASQKSSQQFIPRSSAPQRNCQFPVLQTCILFTDASERCSPAEAMEGLRGEREPGKETAEEGPQASLLCGFDP